MNNTLSRRSSSTWNYAKALTRTLWTTDVKQLPAAIKSIPYSTYGGNGYGATGYDNGYGYSSVSDLMLYSSQPGAAFDYATAAGEPGHNSVVAACVEAVSQALPQAPPVLEKRNGDTWERVPDDEPAHDVIDLLNRPNPWLSAFHIWSATVQSEMTTGNGFWVLVTGKGTGKRPVEIRWERQLAPRYDAQNFIKDYILWVDGKRIPLSNDEVVHFRYAPNPANPRWGWTPLSTVLRHIAGDNAVATYHAAIIRNGGAGSYAISAQHVEDLAKGNITPGQFNEYLAAWEKKLQGEGAGRLVGMSLPLDVKELGWSPDKLALEKLPPYYEARICSVLGVPPMLLGLSSGEETKTYSNLGEAIQDFWQRKIKPMRSRHAAELGAQLLPLFDLNPEDYRINWDYSQVDALQESEDSIFKRYMSVTPGPFVTVNEARAALHLDPVEGGDELVPQEDSSEPPTDNGQPTTEWTDEETSKLSSLWTSAENDELLQAFPGHTESDIMAQARSLGLPGAKSWMGVPDTFTLNGYPVNGYSNGHSTAAAAIDNYKASWDESQHPRDEDGKFSSEGGHTLAVRRGLTVSEAQALQKDLQSLPFPVNFSAADQGYARGMVHVRPRKSGGQRAWTPEQWQQVQDVLRKHGINHSQGLLYSEHSHFLFNSGADFLLKETSASDLDNLERPVKPTDLSTARDAKPADKPKPAPSQTTTTKAPHEMTRREWVESLPSDGKGMEEWLGGNVNVSVTKHSTQGYLVTVQARGGSLQSSNVGGAHTAPTPQAAFAKYIQERRALSDHKYEIELALNSGQDVPAKVLEDYPDLRAKYGHRLASSRTASAHSL